MTVLPFNAVAGRDLILGQLMHAMQTNDYNTVYSRSLDLLKRHSKDPASLEPFLVTMEHLHENDQSLLALRCAVSAIEYAEPGSNLMESAANLVVNSADHVPPEELRSVLDELCNAAVLSSKDLGALTNISEKLCQTVLSCDDLHKDFATATLVGTIEKLILPDNFDGDLVDLYFEDENLSEEDKPLKIDAVLPPYYFHALTRLADQFSRYDQQTSFMLYNVIVLCFSEAALQGHDIPEKLHALMVATDCPGKAHLAFGAANVLVDGGMLICQEIEDSAHETMARTNAASPPVTVDTAGKNIKPVPLKDFLDAFTPSGP